MASSGKPDDIPYALRIGAEWAWRLGALLIVGGALLWLLSFVTLLVIPIMVAALLAGLLLPVVNWLSRHRVPRGAAVAITELGLIVVVAGALALVGRQLYTGFQDLWDEALRGVQTVQQWLSDGPLRLTTEQVEDYLRQATEALEQNSSSILTGALSFGSSAGNFGTGFVLSLFILIFFLYEGERIWKFLVGLMPRRARRATDGTGRRGWSSLVNYVRVQVFVALVDAVGIGVGAAIIGVPLALPLGVLVFLGSFIPIVGALFTGAIAVLLALVANGPINALVMLAIVLVVQQLESNVLQPLIMGKAVSLHPVAVILAVTAGTLLAGIPGALFSVPLLAVTNSSIRYIASRSWETDPAVRSDAEYSAAGPPDEQPDEQSDDDGEAAADGSEAEKSEEENDNENTAGSSMQ
ncbi:AI-2E family transporter [Acaricomes phytoseiuli]|uniref:AI-2E family transporter n=1 Tax=Acaricomes phytoseiuli TaxID=291968 RepID=UPI000373A948|nr:AI-2E family transporter [Acaricomes phytoseiuli]MCW1248953.1 AI-2E family transporter [Acaricomes phytoseiuli]